MARQRGLVHIVKSSLASALDHARQHVMGVSPPSSFEESSGGYTGHVRKVWEFGSGPNGTGRIRAFAKNGDIKREFRFGYGKPFDSSAKKDLPFLG
ncbi:hypothetical protein TNCT_439181 [Trichonephila clavata]|uniref:Uncharacterized protein n=1 Tax=Trichonephila clavata TaxID=2740835 RepID=A0A8X6GLM4_TRICU|nr:hypothetical protein TNCT_439181 [Trichonephila clavata]